MNRGFASIIIITIIVLIVVGAGAFILGKGGISLPKVSQENVQDSSSGVVATGSKYKTVSKKPTGWFTSGQAADIMLSGAGFNNSGGPLLFNHPGNIASDGIHFLLADRNNNRVLIWNKLPTGNTPPDLVLGQKDFVGNDAGTDLDRLNWPVAVAVANGKVVVGDTNNDRVLIWNSIPAKNGQSPDLVLADERGNSKGNIGWPWAVWTNGEKLITTSTGGTKTLIWNSFPVKNNQESDIVLTANGQFGTPRSIASDGKSLVIGDHNAKLNDNHAGNFFWKNFPTEDAPYDFFVADVYKMGEESLQPPPQGGLTRLQGGDVFWGGMTEEGKLIGLTNMLYLWNSFPENENDGADLKVGGIPGKQSYDFGGSQSGDGSSALVAGGKLYLSLYNGNKVVGFNSLPTRVDQRPDFAIGAPDINTNTLETNFMLTNATLATDGKSLFAGANFGKLYFYVWKDLPDESGAKPDFVYDLKFAPRSIATNNNILVVAGGNNIAFWKKIPLNGEEPDQIYRGKIGTIQFSTEAVAFDERYFYLVDDETGKIYAWEGFPDENSIPKFSLSTKSKVKTISSDGNYLAVASGERDLAFYKIEPLVTNPQPIQLGRGNFNLPASALVYQGKLFVADTGFNRVQIWNKIEDAIAGKKADVILGQAREDNPNRPILSSKGLFMPARLAFDGSFLWVGEFKFSGRILRFSVH